MTITAAVYLRISLDRHGDGLAIDRQREDCLSMIEHRGWTLYGIYDDPSISASDARKNRPGYDRMVKDWKAGKFEAIVCWDLDRLTRQPRQLEDWIDAAEQRGLRLVTANGEADLTTDAGRMFARIKAAVSRQEIERKSARQVRAAQQRAQQGKSWGPRRPFGFSDDKVSHHPIEAPVVREIYADHLAGVGQREICRRLNARGIKTTMGNDWSQAVLRNFLRNPRNAGLAQYKGEIVGQAQWDPLVPESIWRAALDRMDGDPKSAGGASRKYLLVGVATCGTCGRTLASSRTKGGVRIYVCRNGSHVTRDAERVEELVIAVALERLKREGSAILPKHDPTDSRNLPAEASALRDRLNTLAVDFADGGLTSSQLRAASQRIQQQLEQINRDLTASAQGTAFEAIAGAEDVDAAWSNLDMARQRGIIEALMNIAVLPTGRGRTFRPEHVQITWKGQE